MKTIASRFWIWTPRILCLVFAGFISLFALDVFPENHGFWNTALALLIHLIPTGVLLIILAASWRWEWIAGILFPALAVFYIVAVWGRFHWPVYLIIAGPLFLIGAQFLLSWNIRRHIVKA